MAVSVTAAPMVSAHGQADRWLVPTLWAIVSLVNLFKPFHIDDTAHLLIAEWISSNPLRPMSGLLNWADTAEPIFVTNQPHFYFYMMALVGGLFGFSEIPIHLLLSGFAFCAIAGFHMLASRFAPDHRLFLTACFALSPGFLVNQNTMVDVPLVALMMAAVLLATSPSRQAATGLGSFGLHAFAVLTKYSSLFLYPVLFWATLIRRKQLALLAGVLPLAAVLAWSAFNIADYGAAHIANRPGNPMSLPILAASAVGFIGSAGIFTLPVAVWLFVSARTVLRVVMLLLGIVTAAAYLGFAVAPGKATIVTPIDAALTVSAMLVGFCAALRGAQLLLDAVASRRPVGFLVQEEMASGAGTLLLWLAGGVTFIVFFAPFQASRHALLIMPPLLLLACQQRRRKPMPGRGLGWVVGLAAYAASALYVAAADWKMAEFYRSAAFDVAARARSLAGPDARIHFRGHWGWQWYARQAGMREFDLARPDIAIGELLADPADVPVQQLPDGWEFEIVGVVEEPRTPFVILDTGPLYNIHVYRREEPNLGLNEGRRVWIKRRVR